MGHRLRYALPFLRLTLVFAFVSLAGAGCASSAGPTTVTFDGSACRVTGQTTLASGLSEFRIVNLARTTGNVVMGRLADGFDASDVREALTEGNTQPPFIREALISHLPAGGTAGYEKTVSYNLSSGSWVVVCATNLPPDSWVSTDLVSVN